MDNISAQAISTKHIGHLGLVADKIDELGLIDLIDQRLPVSKECGAKLSHGERVAAMIINGLGFIDTRLYLFTKFLEDKAIDRLFDREVQLDWFNDDALGRCLDAISDYGVTKLFTELSFLIGEKKGLLGESVHVDTTTLSLYGEYESDDPAIDGSDPRPKQGYAKSGRHDLKQMVLLLATTGASSFPVWMEAHSGNESDQKTMPKAAAKMRSFCKQLRLSPDFIFVGDSALYSNILKYSDDMRWISRVPERIKDAKNLIEKEDSGLTWHTLNESYCYSEHKSTHQDVEQRWVLFFSKEAFKRECKTLEKNIKKEHDAQTKAWWHLSNRVFKCREDCLAEIEKLSKTLKYYTVQPHVEPVEKHKGRGRPKQGAAPEIKGYRVHAELSKNDEKIAKVRRKKGRFILATNVLDANAMPPQKILSEYKDQSGTEQSFKFIKDDKLQVDSVFLKTPARITALMMVMTLCLMVYGVSQHDLRESLAKANETVESQTKKQTAKPSLMWIYFLFRVVTEVRIKIGDTVHRVVSNVNRELKKIARHFGRRARAIYLNSG